MLNFGALIAFMGVNLSVIMHYYVRAEQKKLTNLIPPLIGFLVCLLLWINLSRPAQILGGIWMLIGIIFGAWKTRGFRGNLIDFNLPEGSLKVPLRGLQAPVARLFGIRLFGS